nr:zinc finger, CCHC-type [Tanacetum cinerariifolium]
ARDAGFLWERVGKVMGSSWSVEEWQEEWGEGSCRFGERKRDEQCSFKYGGKTGVVLGFYTIGPGDGCCCAKHKQYDYQVDSPGGETCWFEFHKLLSQSKDCSQKEGQSVSSYLLKMKSYLDILECLGYAMPNEVGVTLILNPLNKDYDQFVQNYNIHSMGKTIAELHVMLKLHEKVIPKKADTLVVLAI